MDESLMHQIKKQIQINHSNQYFYQTTSKIDVLQKICYLISICTVRNAIKFSIIAIKKLLFLTSSLVYIYIIYKFQISYFDYLASLPFQHLFECLHLENAYRSIFIPIFFISYLTTIDNEENSCSRFLLPFVGEDNLPSRIYQLLDKLRFNDV